MGADRRVRTVPDIEQDMSVDSIETRAYSRQRYRNDDVVQSDDLTFEFILYADFAPSNLLESGFS